MRAWFLVSFAVIIVDQLTKLAASLRLVYAQPVEILPVFDLTLLHNTGAAWSFLSDAGGWQRWLFISIAIGVSSWMALWLAKLERNQQWLAASLALILGGAIGNVIDRIALGYVVDFISVHWQEHYFPAFNIADCAITVGAIMMAIDAFFLEGRREAAAAAAAAPAGPARSPIFEQAACPASGESSGCCPAAQSPSPTTAPEKQA